MHIAHCTYIHTYIHTYVRTLVRTSFMISTLVWLSPFLYSSGQSSSRMRGFSIRRRILEWVTSYTYMHTYIHTYICKTNNNLKAVYNNNEYNRYQRSRVHSGTHTVHTVRTYIHTHALLTLLNITPSNTQQSDNC